MRVLLFGATGRLGSRCVQALLAHQHVVTLYVRNPSKLPPLFSEGIIDRVIIVVGDATDSAGIKKAIVDHDIEGIINVAGNQVFPWQEWLLPKIAKAVRDAAVAVGEERGVPLRAWITSGISIMEYPGTGYLLHDYLDYIPIRWASRPHAATRDVVEAVPLSDLRWSIICVAMMFAANSKQGKFELLDAPCHHNLLLKATSPPAWENTWLTKIPVIGFYLNLWVLVVFSFDTIYEDVADMLAADLESGSKEWIGMKVGMHDKRKLKVS